MIFDSHMHVGSFDSMFGVSLDRDGIEALMREHEITNGVVFYPDNEYVREVVESIPGLYALVWGNPRVPGYVEEVERYLDASQVPRAEAASADRRLPPERPVRAPDDRADRSSAACPS